MNTMTESQRRAVTADASIVLVIAGAGSGKTMVLVERIVHLLCDRGADVSDLMVLTFTRKAAGELRDRLCDALADRGWSDPRRDIERMLCGTFHAVAFRILSAEREALGYAGPITIIDPDDGDMLLRQACLDLGLATRGRDGGVTWRSGSWAAAKRAVETFYASGELPDGDSRILLSRFFGLMKSMGVMDYGSIMVALHDFFTSSEEGLARYRRAIKHVMVDELQDSDAMQHSLYERLAPPATLFAVGDYRQSIYGFRGARPDLMLERRPDAEIIDLRECFRCGDAIVSAANRLIAHNGDALAQPMIGATGRDGCIETRPGRSSDVAALVEELTSSVYGLGDVAVLARRHSTLRRLERVFSERKIPCYRVGSGFDLCETPEFRRLIAALRLCVNGRDDLAYWIIHDRFVADDEEWAALRSAAKSARASLLDSTPANNELAAIIKEISVSPDESDIVSAAVRIQGGHDDLTEWLYTRVGGMAIEDGLQWISLRDTQDDVVDRSATVTLATIHAAKGLEWPVIILASCNEGELPSSRSTKEDDGVEEERRLAYVAITRAKERCYLHWRRPEDQADDRPVRSRSRFLEALG